MKEILKFTFILTVFCASASFGLGFVYTVTSPIIEAQRRQAIQIALKGVLPSAEIILPVTGILEKQVYCGHAGQDSTGPVVGYAIIAYGQGYSSKIQTMVGIDTNGVILGIEILYQQETPGLGAKVNEVRMGEERPWFQRQFIEKSAFLAVLDKDRGEIQSITGSTISSRAVLNSIKREAQWLKEKGLIAGVQ